MANETEHSFGYYVARSIGGIFLITAVPLALFVFTVSNTTNLTRVCMTAEGEVFRLVSFAEDEDPWLSDNATLLDSGRNAAFVAEYEANPDLPKGDASVRFERARETVAECGEPFVLDFAARDLDPASEEFAKIHAE